MKIAVINRSPKCKDSNTNVIAAAFLKGVQGAGVVISGEISNCST